MEKDVRKLILKFPTDEGMIVWNTCGIEQYNIMEDLLKK
jgi:hypothetical protein